MSNKKGPEILYYNVEIINPNSLNNNIYSNVTTASTNSEVNAKNNIPILENPSDYYMSIMTASIPLRNCPLFQILIQTPINSPADINKTIYSVTFQYREANGTLISSSDQEFLIYQPRNYYQVPNYQYPAPVQLYTPYYYCYQLQQILDMINTAFANALTNLKTKPGSSPIAAALPPYISYDNDTQLLKITSSDTYYDSNSGNPYIAVYCNVLAEPFFSGFPKITSTVSPSNPNGADRELIMKSYSDTNVVNGVLTTYQNYTNYGYWTFIKNIYITTNMNVNSEIFYINLTNQQQQNLNTYGILNTQNQEYLNVLYSFLPDLSQLSNELAAGAKIQIFNAPTNMYHPLTFNQSSPLYEISIAVYVQDKFGNVIALPLSPNDSCNFKLQFIRKDLVKF